MRKVLFDRASWSWVSRAHLQVSAHSYLLDAVVAVIAFLATLAPPYLSAAPPTVVGWVVVLAVGQSLPLGWRRLYPVTVFCAVGLATLLSSLVAHAAQPPVAYTLLIALYAVAARGPRVIRLGCLAVALAASAFASHRLIAVVLFGLTLVTSYALGASARARSVAIAALEAQRRQWEFGQELARENAAAQERARIAGDLHDILAHSISTMIVSAEAATLTVQTEPERAVRMMDQIADGGRGAMANVRALLGLLEPTDLAELELPMAVVDLPALVATFRDAGLPVTVTVSGQSVSAAREVELAAYRVVQEALTNTLRHANAGQAWVELIWSEDLLTLRVCDDGRGRDENVRDGRGLGGLRERVLACGGSARIGPGSDDTGFQVTASLPLPRLSAATR